MGLLELPAVCGGMSELVANDALVSWDWSAEWGDGIRKEAEEVIVGLLKALYRDLLWEMKKRVWNLRVSGYRLRFEPRAPEYKAGEHTAAVSSQNISVWGL